MVCIAYEYYWAAGVFLVLKSVLDAADGELARLKKTPSYTGRFLDSIADILINFFLILLIVRLSDTSIFIGLLAFLCMQLQGTLYNYYYSILRSQFNGDTTSRVFEDEVPTAFPGEKQQTVRVMYYLFRALYGGFDQFIYRLDPSATKDTAIPGWLMTPLSIFGLGFQLLLMSILLIAGFKSHIAIILIALTALLPLFILIRKWASKTRSPTVSGEAGQAIKKK
jgi:phosphatidylglycerophosphate synthase